MKYRKKPVVIEAFQLFVDPIPDWFMDKVTTKECNLHHPEYASIKTLEGWMLANARDYIIKGIQGELYPCKEDIFKLTYDIAVEPTRYATYCDDCCCPLDECYCGEAVNEQ